METIVVATILYRTVLFERIFLETRVFDRQRVIDDQLGGNHRIHLGRVTALVGNRVSKPCQVDQGSLAEDVVTDHARRKPRKIEFTLALDELLERIGQHRRITATHQVLGQYA